MSKYTGGKNEKSRRGFLVWKTMSINGFPIQILLPKSKEKRTEVISRLLSLLLHTNYKNIWTFLNIFILVPQLWCHEFRKYSFNHILKVCKALLKNQHVLLKACKHETFL